MRQHPFETIEEEGMHVREMACVLVRGPPSWRRPPSENRCRHLPHERHDDVWGAPQRVNNGSDRIHSQQKKLWQPNANVELRPSLSRRVGPDLVEATSLPSRRPFAVTANRRA